MKVFIKFMSCVASVIIAMSLVSCGNDEDEKLTSESFNYVEGKTFTLDDNIYTCKGVTKGVSDLVVDMEMGGYVWEEVASYAIGTDGVVKKGGDVIGTIDENGEIVTATQRFGTVLHFEYEDHASNKTVIQETKDLLICCSRREIVSSYVCAFDKSKSMFLKEDGKPYMQICDFKQTVEMKYNHVMRANEDVIVNYLLAITNYEENSDGSMKSELVLYRQYRSSGIDCW